MGSKWRDRFTQFFRTELEVCIVRLSRVTQKGGEPAADIFIEMRNRYKIHLPETAHMKMIQSELDIELTKKFKAWS